MDVLKIGAYKQVGKYNFPPENIDPSLKRAENKSWFLQNVRAMTSMYVNNLCMVPFRHESTSKNVSINLLRAYATGQQGNVMVKKMLLKETTPGSGQFKTKTKDIYRTYDVLPEFFDVIRAQNQRQDYEINATCVDNDSVKERELEKGMMKHLLDARTKDLMDRAQYKPSTQFTPEEMQSMTEADVDNIFDSGGYLLQKELAAIACCEETKNASGYKGIENKCNDDIITIALAGVKNYVDKAEQTIKMRYVDPKNAYIPYSQFMDFRDITRAGEYRKITIGELMAINPELTNDQITELVEGYLWLNPEYRASFLGTGQYMDPNNFTQLENCHVWVFDCQWLSQDIKTKLKGKHPLGNDISRDVKSNYELSTQEKNKNYSLKRTKVIKKYEAIWVVGTDILLSHGQCEDVAYYGRNGNKTPKLDYFFAQTGNMSLVQRCIPHVDDINLNTAKLRNAVATLPPAPRMVIQQQLLDNVYLNGIKQQPTDLIQTLVEVGYLVVNGVDDHGRPVYQNSKAIEFISTNIVEDVNLFSGLINDSINRMRQVLGLPEGLDGTAGNPYQGKAKTELAADASSNALFPSLSKINEIFQPAFNDVVKKWQVYSKGRGLSVSYSPLGSTTKKILALGAEFPKADVEVEITLAPNEQQKQFLLNQLNEMSLQYTNTQGALGTSKSEYIMLFDLIMAGKTKLAMFKISQIEKRREQMNTIQKNKDQQFNIDSQTKSAQVTATEARKTATVEETEKRLTSITTEAQKRKTAATTAYINTFDSLENPMPEGLYQNIMKEADDEVAAAFQGPVDADSPPEQQQEAMAQEQETMPMQ